MENLKKKIKELERQIQIKDAYCNMIWMIGCDYDGYTKPDGLKSVIDEIVSYAVKAIDCDDKSPMYIDDVENKRNILMEKVI